MRLTQEMHKMINLQSVVYVGAEITQTLCLNRVTDFFLNKRYVVKRNQLFPKIKSGKPLKRLFGIIDYKETLLI